MTQSALNWGSVPDWIVAITAVFGTVAAVLQLRRVAQANAGQVNIARAELMLEIDGRFESEHMLESRLAIQTLRNHCERRARQERPDIDGRGMFNRAAELFSEEMTKLHKQLRTPDQALPVEASLAELPNDKGGERYFALMRLPYWMETVGELTRAELLPINDVLDLYDAVFDGVLACFERHILYRRETAPLRNDRFLENALWIRHAAIERQDRRSRDAARVRSPRRSGLFRP